jgi:peroxiredoxin Q/BCP
MRISLVLLSVPFFALAVACAKDEAAPPPPTTPTTSSPVTAAPAAPAAPVDEKAAAAPAASAAPPSPATPIASPTEVTVGQPAPDFTGKDQDGKTVHLADLKGKPVVVYFYPKDETPGCTKEACSFRDAWTNLQKKGVQIIGISTDTEQSHKAFATHHKLPFTLVSDPKGEIAAKYGVPISEGYVARQSFVVAPDGKVKKVYRKVDVTVHAAEIAADVQ